MLNLENSGHASSTYRDVVLDRTAFADAGFSPCPKDASAVIGQHEHREGVHGIQHENETPRTGGEDICLTRTKGGIRPNLTSTRIGQRVVSDRMLTSSIVLSR